jgi:hypothetical protein
MGYNLSIVTWLILAALALPLLSCGGSSPDTPLFPASAGAWKLKQSRDLAAVNIPEPLRRLGVRRAGEAEYEGPGVIKVEVYEFTSSAAPFVAEQTWKPAANTVAVHHESRFNVIHWDNADKAALSAFVREMVGR